MKKGTLTNYLSRTSNISMERSILRIWDDAVNRNGGSDRPEGFDWYTEANAFAAELSGRYGITIRKAAKIIAMTSPQVDWDRNKINAEMAISNSKGYVPVDKWKMMVPMTTRSKIYDMVSSITEDNEDLAGLKTNSFMMNILLDPSFVTIDRHAIAIALPKMNSNYSTNLTAKSYRRISQAYQRVADQLGVPAMVVQAVTWVEWRIQKWGGDGTYKNVNSPR